MTNLSPKLQGLSCEALVASFADAASAREAALEERKPRVANKHFDRMTGIYLELKARGIEAQRSLLPLLAHSDPGVKAQSRAQQAAAQQAADLGHVGEQAGKMANAAKGVGEAATALKAASLV
jgi:Domain of unknown function (DUF2019)